MAQLTFERGQFVLEENILLGPNTVNQCGFRPNTQLIDVSQHRDDWRNATSSRDHNGPVVLAFIKTELSIRPSCLDCQARSSAFIQELRYTAIFDSLGRDLYEICMRWRRAD